MYLRIALTCAFLAVASCRDIEIGLNSTDAHKIYDEKREASPAVWRQVERVTVNTTDEEVISRVVVTDQRPDKDGDANIVEGGEGNQSVTIELKSPTVLRGFQFHIEVYAVPNKGQQGSFPAQTGNGQSKIPHEEGNANILPPTQIGAADFSTKQPVPLSTDVKLNDEQRVTRSADSKTDGDVGHCTVQPETKKHPIDITKDIEADDSKRNTNQKFDDSAPLSLKTNSHSRHARDTAKSQITTEVPSTTHAADSKNADGQAVNYPQWRVDRTSGNTDKILVPGILAHDNKDKDLNTTTVPSTTTATDKPRAARDTEVTSPKTAEHSDKNVQKIPANGRIDIPKDVQDSLPKGLDKPSQDSKSPAPYVPLVPIPLQGTQVRLGEKSSTEKPKTVGNVPPSWSDDDESSEEDKKSTTLQPAQKPKSL